MEVIKRWTDVMTGEFLGTTFMILLGGGVVANAMNPARDLAPRIAHWVLPIVGKGRSGWQYARVSIAGAVLAVALRRVFL